MPDPFRKWAQGDEFVPSASQMNAWTDAAKLVPQALRGQPTPGSTDPLPFTTLRIHNATGARIPRFGVISFATPQILPADDVDRFALQTTLEAIVPAAPLDRFAIVHREMAIGEVANGVAQLLGIVPCRITGEGQYAQAIDGDVDKLQAGGSGHPLIWQETGTDERLALIQLGVSDKCPNKKLLRVEGNTTAGTFVIRVGGSIANTDITVDYDASAATVEADLNTATGEVFRVTGVTILNNDLTIVHASGLTVVVLSSSLTPGTAYARMISCCGES